MPSPLPYLASPPIGTVGLSEAAAIAAGHPVDIYESDFRPMKYTLGSCSERTYIKLVVHAETDVVLGAHIIGLDAAEIIQGIGIAVKARLTKAQFDATIAVHPTSAEEFVLMRDKRK